MLVENIACCFVNFKKLVLKITHYNTYKKDSFKQLGPMRHC